MSPEPRELANALRPETLRAFGRVQLIALDLDGTAVSSGSDIVLGKIKDQVHLLQRKGVKVLVATGRTLTKARDIALQLSVDERSPVVLFNGAVETNIEGVEVNTHHLPVTAANELASYAFRHGQVLLLYRFVPADVLQRGASEVVLGVGPAGARFPREFNGLEVRWVESPSAVVGPFNTGLLLGEHRVFEMPILEGVDVTSSGANYIEFRPAGIDKGRALMAIAMRLAIARKHVLAIGDNDNDCEMLDWAGLSVVPANASAHAKNVASYVSSHGEFHCVIETLRVVLDGRRLRRNYRRKEQ